MRKQEKNKMPAQDRTGPLGQGPMTGRGLGPCGRGLARGRGFGRGRGFSFRQQAFIEPQVQTQVITEAQEKDLLKPTLHGPLT